MEYNWQDDKKAQDACRSIGSYPYITNYEATKHLEKVKKDFNICSLIDLGCGRGNILDYALAADMETVDGVEYIKSYISAARRRLKKYEKSRYTLYQGDIRFWKPKKKYDVIYTFEPFFQESARNSFYENLIEYLPDNQLVWYALVNFEPTHKLFTNHFEHIISDIEIPLFKFHQKPKQNRNTFWENRK